MAVARVDNPWVRNLTLAPSRVYATSPYRPYAGVFNNTVNVSTGQYQDNFIRALSPFSINDKNVIDAIRKEYNIIDNGNYRMASNIGFGIGAVAGVGISAALYSGTVASLYKVAAGGFATMNPIGWGVGALATGLAIVGTVMTSAQLGRAIGASVGSREGSIAMSRYLANLGNSMVKRPTSTALTVATIFATNWALNKTPIKSPIVRQGITMAAMRVVRPIADKLDDSLFGELSEVDQMSYTDLLSLQGDLADNFSGTSLVKSALAGISGGKEKSAELIAKMYGRHEEGFDPLDFNDVRETWGIDIGTFGNGVIDILGEIVFDTDNSVNTIKNKVNTTISTSVKNQVVKKILSNENSDLFKRYFEGSGINFKDQKSYNNFFIKTFAKLLDVDEKWIEYGLDDFKFDPNHYRFSLEEQMIAHFVNKMKYDKKNSTKTKEGFYEHINKEVGIKLLKINNFSIEDKPGIFNALKFLKEETEKEKQINSYKIKAKDTFKNEFQNKIIQRVIENYLDDYKDPSTAKTTKERNAIIKENNTKLDHHIGDLYVYLYRKGLANIKEDSLKITEAQKIIGEIKKEIQEGLNAHSGYMEKNVSDRTKYAKAVKTMVESQKEATKIVNQNFKNNVYNFDKAMLKEFQIHKADFDHNYITGLLKIHPAFYLYSEANNNNMRVLGYFTRPFQSAVASKPGRKIIQNVLNKIQRKFDPYKKVTNVDEIMQDDNPVTKEQQKESLEKLKQFDDVLKDQLNKFEEEKMRQILGQDEIDNLLKELNDIEEFFATNKLTDAEKGKYQEREARRKELIKKVAEAKEEAIKKMEEEDKKAYKRYKKSLNTINDRYKQLLANSELINKYMEMTKFNYVNKGVIQKMEVNKDTEQEVLDIIKDLESKKDLTGDQLITLENAKFAYFLYLKEDLFKEGYQKITSEYNKVIKFIQNFETWFTENAFKLESLVLNTTIFTEVKQLQKEIRDIDSKISKTQDELLKVEREKIKSRYQGLIMSIYANLEKSEIFDKKTRDEIVKALEEDKMIDLPIFYATNFFSGIKLFEEDKSFFLNNKPLFDEFNKRVLEDETQDLLDRLKDSIITKSKTKFELKQKTQFLEDRKLLIKKVQKILLDLNMKEDPENKGSKLLSDENYEILKQNIEGVATSLINTNKSMQVDPTTLRKNNMYSKRFSELSQNDILDYAFRLATKNNEFLSSESKMIDNVLRSLDHSIKQLLQAVKESNNGKLNFLEGFINESIRRQMYKINSSKIINAISAKYLRVGQSKKYFENPEVEGKKINPLSEKALKKISNKKYKFEKTDKEVSKQGMAEEFKKAFEGTAFYPILIKMGFQKIIDDNLLVVDKAEVKPTKVNKKGKSQEEIDFEERGLTYTRLVDGIVKDIEAKTGDLLGNEARKKISQAVAKAINDQIGLVKSEYEIKRMESAGSKKVFDDVFMKKLANSFFGKLVDVENLSSILRGNVSLPKTKIDMTKPDPESGIKGNPYRNAIINFMLNNEPTIDNIMKLKLQPFGTYLNFDGKPVSLESIVQIGEENLVGAWAEKYRSDFGEKDEDGKPVNDPLVFEFFRGIDVTKESNEAYKRYVDASFSLPNSLRNEESLKNLKDEDFVEVKDNFESDGTIANDFIRVFKESQYGHNFKKIAIHKGQFIFKNKIGDKEVTNDIIVIRVTTTGKKSYDFYVPRETIKTYGDQKIATYKVNNNEYMRIMIEGEDEKSLAYLDNISKAIEKDFINRKMISDEFKQKFEPFAIQKEIFRLFSKQRNVGETNELITDFVYLDPDKTDYEKLVYSLMRRLDEGKRKNLTKNKAFIDEYKKNGYFFDYTQSDPKVVMKGIKLKSGEFKSITRVFSPLGIFTGRAERTAQSTNARRNAKKLYTNELPYLSSKFIEENPELLEFEKGGFNARVYLKDFYQKNKNGKNLAHSTHNETVLMREGFAIEKFKVELSDGSIQDIPLSNGMKIIDRNASKHGVRIVSDDEWKDMFKDDDKALNSDVIMSKRTVRKRTLWNVEAELAINGLDKTRKYIDSEMKGMSDEQKLEYLKSQTKDGNLEVDHGYLYMFLTDDLSDNKTQSHPSGRGYKVAGDNDSSNGAKISIEEWQMFSALREITYAENGKRQPIDPEGKLFDFLWNRTKTPESELRESIYGNVNATTGKQGKFRKEIIERRMPNSAYAKAISNTSLEKDEIAIPRAMAESMKLIKSSDGSYGYVLLHRSPTQGRRSFIYAKVRVLDDVEGMTNKAIEVNPAFEDALHLDYDGDGVSIFSLKDATPDVLKIAETAFSHSYKEKTTYSDYALRNEYGIKHKDVDMKTEKDFDINRDIKKILNEEEKPKGYKPSFVSEDQWDNVMLNQKTLKDYSGLFKNIFDADYQDYISSKENMEWFNKTFKSENLSNIKFESFYALTTLAYDFYSQKTFDFSKHSRPGEKESFDKIYSIIKKKDGETFENHIRKLVKVLMFDITNTQKKDSKIELINKRKDISDSKKARLSDIEVQRYLYKLQEFLKEVSREEQRLGKTKPEIIKEAETKKIEGEKVKPEEEFSKQFEEADKQLLRDINKILKDKGLEETTMDKLAAFKSDKLLSITGAFDQNEIKHFNLTDWNLDFKGVNQVFSFMLKMNQNIAKAAKRKMKTNDKVLEPFHKAFTTYIRQVIQSFYQDIDVLKNMYFIKVLEINGEEVKQKIPFLKLINVFGLNPDEKGKRSRATIKNINPAITKMDSIGVAKDVLNLNDKRLRSFYISNESAFESPKLNRLNNELFTKVHNNVRKTLNNMGLGRTPVFSPLLHNKFLFNLKIFDSMYEALMSNEENKSILVDILRDMGDEDSMNELKEIFKPFFMFQSVAEYLSENKRTNFIKYLYQVEGIFDNTIKTVIPEKKTGALIKDLIHWKLMEPGENYEDFGMKIKTLLNINDDKVVEEIIEIYYQMRNGLGKDTYNSINQFDDKDQAFKLDLLVKIHEIKNGKFVEKHGSKYGITQEDLREKTENFEIDDKVMSKFFRIYDYAFETIEGTFDIKNRQRITSALEEEKMNFLLVGNVIKNANHELSKLMANTITIQNYKGEAEDVNPYPFRSLLHPNNIEENSIILMNANKNKMAKNLTERFYRLVMKPFNKEGADSEMAKEIRKISNDFKAGNDIMSLYLFEGKDVGSFIKLINDLINNQQTFTIPLTDRIFKYFLHFNEMSKAMGFDKKIMPGTIDAYYRDIKGSNIVDSEGNIKMNNIYRIMFFDYVYGEGMQIDARNNTPEFQEAFNNLVSYFDKNPNMNTFGLHPHAFIETFFGKMLFEQRVESEKHSIKEDPKLIQEKLIEYYKNRINELEVLYKNRDATSNEYLKAMEEATAKGEALDLSQITIDPVKQQEILDAYKKYLSVELLEEKIVDHKVSNVFDTFEWAKYIGQEGIQFDTKNLFNIYAQLINKKEFSQEEIDNLSEDLSQEIIRDNTNANFKFKGNKKIHTALIDAQLNLKVMDLIVREFEKNEGRYKDYPELKALINDFKDPSKKKNFAIIDSENLVSGNDYNRIYEISYITFDDNGKPLYHQHYLKYNIDKRTENWLKSMGYSDKEIQIIKDNMKNIADPDYNKKIYEQVFADLKGKNIIGQSVKSQGDTPGDIGKLNYEYQQILKNDVRKTIKNHNEKEKAFLDNIKESSVKDLMKNVDNTELNSIAQADMMMKVLIDIVKEDLNERILPQGIEKIDNEQFNTHISKTSELMKVFIKENNPDILKLRMEKILEIDEIPKEVFDAILKKFEDKFQELKGENNDGVLIMKWPRIVKTEDGVRVEFLEVDEKEIVGKNQEFLVKKVRFDPDDIRANFLFRSRAFYEIIKEIKDIIIIRGIPHEHLGKTVQRTITLNQYERLNRKIIRMQGQLDDKNLKVKKHLDDATKFMFEGNEVEYLVSMNKAIKEYEKTDSKMDAFTDIDLETDLTKVDLFLKEQVEKNTGQMANIPMWKVEQHFADMISKFYKDTLSSKRTIEEKEQDYKYIAKIEDIITALEYEDMNTLDSKRFADIVGLNKYDGFSEKIHEQLMQTYIDYKTNGIPFYYAGSDEPYSRLPYKEDGENLFKKMAFYATLNPRSEDKKTLGSFLKMIIAEEGVREYKRYDVDETKQKEIDKVKSRLTNKKVQDPRNEEAFADARIEVKNMILKEDWAGLETYLKDKLGEKFNLEEFKQRFYEEFEKTKTQGIAKYRMEWRMEGQTPTPFEKFIESVPYVEQPGVRGEFLRTVISNFEKEISEMVYIKGYYTTLDTENKLDKILTYKYYNDHLEDYNGKWVPSDYRRDHPQNQTIRKSYDYLRANVDKTRDLSQYQAGFEGMIAPFRKGNSYDYERLLYEITEGYLSKIYKLTIITDISKGMTGLGKLTEQQEIEAATERRNKAFQKGLQKKIDKLEAKIIELQKLNTAEANQEIAQLRLQIEDTKKVVYQKNKYYDEENISKLRRSEPIWKSDEEIFGSSIIRTTDKKGNVVEENILDWMDSIKDTAHPTLKVIALDSNKETAIKQLKELVKLNREKGLHIGFTLLHDILKTDEMSYSGYMLPKPIAMLQSSIIKFQKFMMLMNSGFMVRNIYDGMLRNHQLILGSDDIVSENFRFAKEAVRSWNLIFQYKAYAKAHGFQVRELKHFFESVKDFESGPYALHDLQKVSTDFQAMLTSQIDSLKNYLGNIIKDENQTTTKRASDNYTDFSRIMRRLQAIVDTLENKPATKSPEYIKELKSQLKDFFEVYQQAGFFKQVIMNANDKRIKLDFSDNSENNVKKIKDNLNMIRLINEIEKSGIVSDQYEISGKQDIKDIYRNIDKMLDDELMKVGLNDRIDKILSHHPIAIATNYVEQHQRIHGVLLDIFVNGKTKDRALAESLGRFFNYGMKGAYEKSASVYFPFMSFAIRNLDYYLDLMGDQKYMRFMTNIAQGMNTWYDDEDEENFRFSNSFNDFTENQGWIPLGKNYGIKMGNAMFDAMSLVEDPFQSGYQKLNPILQQANNLTKGEDFNKKALASVTQYSRMASAIGTIAKGQGINMPQDLPDLVPSLFYKRSEYTPYKYRRYSTDYRNIYRNLFFSDGSRRVPSKNPFTTAKNIRYEAYVRARLNANIK